jgi:DNA-binding NarL/FixJ family response regulator
MKQRSHASGMDLDTNTATALVAALGLAREHGSATAALTAAGVDLPAANRCDGLPEDVAQVIGPSPGDTSASEALALGLLAGRIAHRPRPRRRQDPTAFLMDREMVVQAAEGESILRLPWFEDDLFVSRQVPDITEMPREVLALCVESYSAALAGERGRFAFTSYGHSYSVDAVPVRAGDGEIHAVLAIATPTSAFAACAAAHEKLAQRLDHSATDADQRAELHRLADRGDAAAAESRVARKARQAAERARADARRLRSHETGAPAAPPPLTPREIEVLSLASHGLTYTEIAEQLAVTGATVRTHLQNVYAKLGACDKAGAVATALRLRLIE